MNLLDEDVVEFYIDFTQSILAAGFERKGRGSFRRAFKRNNSIIKIPLNADGVADNLMEAKAYRFYKNKPTSLGIHLAPCRLLPNYALLMPYTAHLNFDEHNNMPEWVEMVEGYQVGMHRGRVVAYDFALDLEERYAWEKESLLKSDYFQNHWKNVKPFLFPAECFHYEETPAPTVIFDNVILENRFQDHL